MSLRTAQRMLTQQGRGAVGCGRQVRRAAVFGLLLSCAMAGCSRWPHFPQQPVQAGDHRLAFDLDGDGRDDYWQDVGPDGRKTTLHFDDDGNGRPDTAVRIDGPLPGAGSLPGTGPLPPDILHVVIILDGVPFEVIRELYDQGRFRLFAPPSRLISVFPALTDLALARVFRAGPCLGYEALYYDIQRNRLSNANDVYLSGRNAPWTPAVDYRCSTNWDALAYLDPSAVWRHELDGFARTIAEAQSGTTRMYSVATAGLGTRGGREAIREYLETIEALCEQVTWQRRGKVRFTLLADHGHGLTACKRISLKPALRAAGLRISKSIRDQADVVMPTYGLVTCAVIHTPSPEKAAEAVLKHQATDLVMCRAARPADAGTPAPIIVRNRTGEAEIHRLDDRFVYRAISADPLGLLPVLDRLVAEGKVAADGTVADRDWFEATTTHPYPDALHRIWCAFEPGCLVDNPADVIVSLKDGYACGSKFFSFFVDVESTHGALSTRGSTTFIMSNAVSLPPVLRMEDVGGALRTGRAQGGRDGDPHGSYTKPFAGARRQP